MNYAFIATPTVGHTNFLISLASVFVKNGENVKFFLPGTENKLIRKYNSNPILKIDEKLINANIPYKLIKVSINQFILGSRIANKRGLVEVLYALKIFVAGSKHYYDILQKELLKFNADCIIYDYTFFSAIAISEKLNIKRVAVYHSGLPFFEYPIPPLGSNLKYNCFSEDEFQKYQSIIIEKEKYINKKYDRLFDKKTKITFITSPNSDFLNIINTIEAAEYPRKNLNETVFYTGPSVSGFLNDNNEPFFDKKNKKLIYVSLGTVFDNQPKLFLKIINSITLKNTEILVSAGASYNKLIKQKFSKNIHIKKNVPQLDVLKYADLFITHGGKNSINEAVKFGVPMILFPAGGEQEYNANLVEFLEIGINFSEIETTFTKDDITSAINNLIFNPNVSNKCKKLSAKHIADGAAIAFDLIVNKMNRNTIKHS